MPLFFFLGKGRKEGEALEVLYGAVFLILEFWRHITLQFNRLLSRIQSPFIFKKKKKKKKTQP